MVQTLLAAVASISYDGSAGDSDAANTHMRCSTILAANITDLQTKDVTTLKDKGLFNITFYSSESILGKKDVVHQFFHSLSYSIFK